MQTDTIPPSRQLLRDACYTRGNDMRRIGVTLFVVATLIAVGIYFIRQVAFRLDHCQVADWFLAVGGCYYPPSPSDLPACVVTPLPELLAEYEKTADQTRY